MITKWLAVLALAICARADSIDLTSGQMNFNLDSSGYVGGYVDWNFGPVSAESTVAPLCNFVADTCNASVGVYGGTNGSEFVVGGISLSLADLALPTTGDSFAANLAVLFNGTFSLCPSDIFGTSCTGPADSTIYLINGMGVANLLFTSLGNQTWQLTTATFTLAPPAIPEPSSLLLLGTGLLATGYRRLRK